MPSEQHTSELQLHEAPLSTSPKSNSQINAPQCSVITMSCTWPWTWLRYFTSTHRWDSGQASHVYLTKFNYCTGKNTERTIVALPSHDLPSAGAESPSSPCNLSRLSRQVTLLISRGIFLSSNFCPSCWFWNLIPTLRSSCIIHSVHFETWKGVYLKTPLPKELSPSPEKYKGSYRLKQRHVHAHTHRGLEHWVY